MKRFLRQALRWTAVLLATLITLLLVFYAEEDWRGARDWAACQRDLAARGETLDLRQLIPPGNPQDDLSKVPIFAELYKAERGYDEKNWKYRNDLRIYKVDIGFNSKYPSAEPKGADYFKSESFDLAAWQKFYRSIPETKLPKQMGTPSEDVLKALSQLDPELNEIRTAVSNPNAYWPIDYDSPFEGYIGASVKSLEIAKIIQLEGIAHLDNHEADLAEKDFTFSVEINRPLAQRCMQIDYLILVAVRAIDDSVLWEGLHRHAWNDAQLHDMEASLAETDMLGLGVKGLRAQRAAALKTIDVCQGNHDLVRRAIESGGEGFAFLYLTASIRPSGWWSEDRAVCAQGIQNYIDGIDLNRRTLIPAPFALHFTPNSEGMYPDFDTNIWNQIYVPLGEWAVYSSREMGPKIAKAESYRRLARLACRLEEYRLAHGNQYPDKLGDLPDLPAHLNQEVLSEQPLRYQRKGDGYCLYSLGWNQKDDGGQLATDPKEGDWPWPSP